MIAYRKEDEAWVQDDTDFADYDFMTPNGLDDYTWTAEINSDYYIGEYKVVAQTWLNGNPGAPLPNGEESDEAIVEFT